MALGEYRGAIAVISILGIVASVLIPMSGLAIGTSDTLPRLKGPITDEPLLQTPKNALSRVKRSCNSHEDYTNTDGKCTRCSSCDPGYRWSSPCGNGHGSSRIRCIRCFPDTFRTWPQNFDDGHRCLPCLDCKLEFGLKTKAKCTLGSNTKCNTRECAIGYSKLPDDFRCVKDEGDTSVCSTSSPCISPPSTKNNNEASHNGSQWWLILYILAALVASGVLLYTALQVYKRLKYGLSTQEVSPSSQHYPQVPGSLQHISQEPIISPSDILERCRRKVEVANNTLLYSQTLLFKEGLAALSQGAPDAFDNVITFMTQAHKLELALDIALMEELVSEANPTFLHASPSLVNLENVDDTDIFSMGNEEMDVQLGTGGQSNINTAINVLWPGSQAAPGAGGPTLFTGTPSSFAQTGGSSSSDVTVTVQSPTPRRSRSSRESSTPEEHPVQSSSDFDYGSHGPSGCLAYAPPATTYISAPLPRHRKPSCEFVVEPKADINVPNEDPVTKVPSDHQIKHFTHQVTDISITGESTV